MSVIVAVKENGVVYMGADTQSTAGNYIRNFTNETNFKIVRMPGGLFVGFCGSVGAKQKILSYPDTFVLDENGGLTKKHIVKNIIPKLVGKLEEIGDTKGGGIDVSIILACKDKIYTISSKLAVTHRVNYATTGSGMFYVHYVINKRKDLPPKERILKAMEESARWEDTVGGPFVLVDTKEQEYEIFDGGER